MHPVLLFFLIFLALETAVRLLLQFLNHRHVQRHGDRPPERFRAWIGDDAYRRSVRYTLSRSRLTLAETLFDGLVLALFVLAGGFGAFDRLIPAIPGGYPLVQGVVYIGAVSLFFVALSIPFRLYGQFVIEERFGFNRMTFRLWLRDRMLTLVLAALIGGPVLYVLLVFMEATGALWWVWAAAFVLALLVFLQFLYPLLIAPLFNKFVPLENVALRDAVHALADRTGFALKGVYQMDASRRSSHGNAYFTGVGKSRRIVLFDTLLKSLQDKEILAVLAHEIGHWKLRHVASRLVSAGLLQLGGFFALSRLMAWEDFYLAFGFQEAAPYRALAIFAFCAGPFVFFLTPALTVLSRRQEYGADRFAVQTMGSAHDLSQALLRLSRDNLSNLTPHPWHSAVFYSHPPLAERLAALDDVERQMGGASTASPQEGV